MKQFAAMLNRNLHLQILSRLREAFGVRRQTRRTPSASRSRLWVDSRNRSLLMLACGAPQRREKEFSKLDWHLSKLSATEDFRG
jgi:hypothetical protein